MSALQVSLLGEFACHAAEGRRLGFPTRKVEALLAYLAMGAGRWHLRSKLAGLLWEDMPESQARANLRKALSRLQQALPLEARECLMINSREIGLEAGAAVVDVEAFERWLADGTPETLEQALALYRGPFLEGMNDAGEAFEDWLMAHRLHLDEALQQLMHRLLAHYVVTGAIDPGIQLALRLLAIDPLDEGVQRTLIRFYLYQDRIGTALEQYRRCRQRLADELGVAPAPETERLKAELLALLPSEAETTNDLVRERDDLPERSTVIEAAAATRARHRATDAAYPALAVLAFRPDETAGLHCHLGVGLAEDIATELGRFRELVVIAPASALAYRDAPATPAQIGIELGVDYLLEGQFRRRGDALRLTARLLQAASARQVWAERYDCGFDEIVAVQDDIASQIVGNLIGRIEDDRLEAMRRKPPQDWHAYDLWLRGWSALRRPDLAAIHEARRYFQQALARDPRFARAYVGLALAHLNEWACFSWNHWAFLRQETLEFARQAVALDEHDHRAHCMLGLAELYSRRYDSANRELSLALTLNPNDADVLAHASFALALIGEPARGVEAARKALRLAPYRPEWHAGMTGIAFFSARHYQEAIDIMASAPQAFCNTPAVIAAAHAHLGQPERAVSHRDTVYRHYRYQLARGAFPKHMSCLDWLLALDPYRHDADRTHYLDGLRRAGFA
ncbi:TolB amino-terminal domain-containing protein [Modicisalibacter ilicicola DSM 19980]|uniref:TolB amino-terminal domain-containing protein n=1 Tax=Modicisalibacter ilicicola DSM 19980 TaxID=1121942 RepID=A0A1M5BY10_9GAMM|nr:BTAD domain-containing putative transcriptional regulator [Halomonas ilicicola]SHF47339.1 TolB amino-terminal domain-containing protein [Halomonas ilicicola DSM 19980]